ncbi:MAG TPA: hypothetical protein VGB82_05980 [Alphaproteobacteria bacterium]
MTSRDDRKPIDEDCVANPPVKEKHQRFSRYAGEPDKDVDAIAEDSFPASDPPSYSGSTSGTPDEKRSAAPKPPKRKTQKTRVSETRPHKPPDAGDKSVEELAKQDWPGVDADGETG